MHPTPREHPPAATPTGRPATSTRPLAFALVVVAVATLAHATALAGGLVWLDHAHLTEGMAIAPPSRWLQLFGVGFAGTGYYRPLVALSLSIDARIGGTFVHHLVNVAWHAAAAASVAPLARALGVADRSARIAALLFAAHPATSLVAAAIAFRSEAMLVVALVWTLVFHLRGRPLLAAACLLAATLTKETALVVGPALVVASSFARAHRPGEVVLPDAPTLRRSIAAQAVALLVALGLRVAFAPGWRGDAPPLTGVDAVSTRLAVLARTIALLVAPTERTVCDAFAIAGPTSPRAFLGLGIAVGLVVLVVRRRGPAILLAVSLLPAIQLVALPRFWSPHYAYLPLAFATCLLAEELARATRTAWIPVIVILGLSAVSLADDRRFVDDERLFAPEVAANPACREGHFYLGEAARARGAFADAEAHYLRALAERPGVLAYVDARATLVNLGVSQLEQGRLADADRSFERALALTHDPLERRRVVHNLAGVALGRGDAEACLALLAEEVARPDAFPSSIALAARALRKLGRDAEANALEARE